MQESNKRLKTKRTIENAMVQLLMEQPFDKISTVKLVEKAGISRSSFYTHYKDKYDMIEHYQSKLFHTFEYIFQKHAHHKRDAILEVFEYLESEPLLAALLSENGTKEIQNFLRNKLHIMLSTDLQKRFMQLNLNTTEFPNHSYLSQLDVTYKTPDLMSHFLPPHEVSFTFCCSSIVFPR
ncbi:TetR family transcriptional regulator [Streptococcus pneumoniae]|nr:TetR family transcriptional regulator [Streptococcus pneumoniae]